MSNQTIVTLKYANLQMAAEALFGQKTNPPESKYSGSITTEILTDGNDHASKFTTTQATEFAKEWKVVEHISNTKTGFSGTLFECLKDDEAKGLKQGDLVLSFRSTEFIDDSARDNQATNAMEIKAMGFAFGQIADMSDWFEKLNLDTTKLGGGKSFAVTGYSLGGHLATAFNALYGGTGRIKETYTFNGAGVGLVKSGQNLNEIIDTFNKERKDGSGGGGGTDASNLPNGGGGGAQGVKFFNDPLVQATYENLRDTLSGGERVTDAQINMVNTLTKTLPSGSVVRPEGTDMLLSALKRIKTIQEEFDRLDGVSSSGGNQPQGVELKNIEAMNLSYQVAALRASKKTIALGLDEALQLTVTDGRNTKGAYNNFYDVYGDTYPSAVSNSQYHYGKATPVFIEDQPLWRGNVISKSARASWDAFDVKLLVNNYDINDFGDTHSLVLMVDSLSVQTVLAKLDSSVSGTTLTTLLKSASNKTRETVDGWAGKAEGDVLENVVNGLGKMLGVLTDGTKLKGNLEGNTWHVVTDEGAYTGRETFHKKLADIEAAIASKDLAGKVKVGITNTDLGALAREDFGAMATLLSMSPVSLTASSPEHRDKLANELKGQFSEYAAWKADKEMSAQDKAAGKQTYSDAYLRARAEMLDWKGQYNDKNLAYDKELGVMVSSTKTLLIDPVAIKVSPLPIKGDHVYQDNKVVDGKTLKLEIDGINPLTTEKHRITFGIEAAETLTGGEIEDRLFGGAGADTLKGLGGSDYLEGNEGADNLEGGDGKDILVGGKDGDVLNGGKDNDQLQGGDGSDTYQFDNQFGHDTIIDADGNGFIQVAGIGKLDGANAKKVAGQEGVWRSNDGKVTYTKVQLDTSAVNFDSLFKTGLEIKFADRPNDSILIKGWSSEKHMGLQFDPTPEAPKPYNPYAGDFQKETVLRYQQGQNRLVYKETYGGYVSTGQAQPNADDYIAASISEANENFRIEGLGGNDALFGAVNDDFIDGGDGDDFLAGGGGQDSLYGGAGRDYILGSNFHSKHYPRDEQNNILYVEVGKEHPEIPDDATLQTQGFDWAIYTQPIAGSDQVRLGLQGLVDPYIYPWNHLVFQDKGKFIDAGEDNDYVISGTGADTTYGGDGDDTLTGLDDADVLLGEKGNDLVYGDGSSRYRYDYLPDANHGSDVISGGEGNDQLIGQGKDDQVFGGDGDDKLWGDGQGDQLDPTDTPYDIQGNDYLDGGAGADQLIGGGRDDQLIGGGGDDRLWGDFDLANLSGGFHGKDVLDGEQGDDYLEGGGNEDMLRGGDGNDRLLGDASSVGLTAEQSGADSLEAGQGDDYLDGGGKSDVLFGGAGSDELHGDGEFAAANDQGDDFLDGGEGSDGLFGEGGDDYLRGGAGNDFLYGGDGNDFLEGGFGADVLKGGGGNDTYAFDGEDTRMDSSSPGGDLADTVNDNEGSNTIILGGASTTSIAIFKDTNDAGTANVFLAQDSALRIQDVAGGLNNTFVLGNGDELTASELIGRYANTTTSGAFSFLTAGGQQQVMAGSGDDNINVSASQSTVSGGGGNDFINAAGAANTYLYSKGDGNDVIVDGSVVNGSLATLGGSTIEFGLGISESDISLTAAMGNSTQEGGISQAGQFLVVQVGGGSSAVPPGKIAIDGFDFTDSNAPLSVSKLKFADGNEVLLADLLTSSGVLTTGTDSNDAVQGIWRAETLSGGLGDDTLAGESGGDTYQWGLGDGKDKVLDAGPSSDVDTLQLLGSLTSADLKFSRVVNDLVVRIATTNGTSGDELTIKDHFAEIGTNGAGQSIGQGIDKVVFGNGVVWNRADINTNLVGLPPVTLTEGNDNYQGTAGSDSVSALSGDDTVVGNEGNDTVEGGAGNDSIYGYEGDDSLVGGSGNDAVIGGADNDVLKGGAGDDTVMGGSGNDWLEDHEGNNSFSGGEGDDTIRGLADGWSVSAGPGNDDVEITGGTSVFGEDGDDRLVGVSDQGILWGGAGNDTLGGGNSLRGESGSDTYLLNGLWKNWIREHDVTSGDIDTVVLPQGTNASNVNFVRFVGDGADSLVIRFDGKEQTTLVNYFGDDPQKSGIDLIRLGDGTVLDRAAVMAVVKGLPVGTTDNDSIIGFRYDDTIDGGVGNDSINGAEGNDFVKGGLGNDLLLGFSGDDTLEGGAGDDVLNGGDGNDTLVFGRNSGKDTVAASVLVAQNDRIRIEADVLPSELKVFRNLDDLVLQISGSTAQFTVEKYYYYFNSAGSPITPPSGATQSFSAFQGIDFAGQNISWSHSEIAAHLNSATSVVTTANGVDTLNTSQSAGLTADIENITAVGLLDVRLVGNVGHNVITGNAGNNSLNGFFNLADPSAWVNWTTDARPTNAFDITFSPSFLTEQKGKDTLVGGAGDDTYFVNGGEQAPTAVGSVELPPVNGDDVVVELAGEGNDTVVTRNYSETLTANVENLIALNSNAYYQPATSTSPLVWLSHVYTGNALNNRIDAYQVYRSTRVDGGAGADTMYGSTRSTDDSTIYVVDNPGDVVIEVNESAVTYSLGDRVESSITYTLGSAIEELTLTGGGAINGTGNANANRLLGNVAANILEGLTGNDSLDGGLGNDTYLYGLGDGVDTIQEATPDTSSGKLNVLRMKAGIAPADVVVKQVGNDLEVVIGGENQKVIVKGFFSGSSPAPGNPIQRIEFDAGVAWDVTKILTLLTPNTPPVLVHPLADVAVKQGDSFTVALPVGTFVDSDPGDNLIYKLTLADGSTLPNWFDLSFNTQTGTINGLAPVNWSGSLGLKLTAQDKNGAQASDVFDIAVGIENKVVSGTALGDHLTGYGGNDSLYGLAGSDVINGNSGNDLLDGGDGNDRLNGGVGMDTVSAGEGGDSLQGGADNDLLQGGGGDDELAGELGDDTLDGGLGNDIYLFRKGHGSDLILETLPDATPGKTNTLALSYDIIESDVTVKKVGVDLEVTVGGSGDKVTVKSFFAGTGPNDVTNPIQRIHFESINKTWDIAKIQSLLSGQDTSPTLAKPLPDQSVKQGATLTYTMAADAFVDADVGDVLTYSAKQFNSSSLPPWLSFNAATQTFSGTAPTDYVGSLSVKVTATDTKGNVASDVFDIVVGAENKTLTGTTTADVLVGYSGDDTLYGLGGNDSLTGNDGNDRLDGGLGSDTLQGGWGSDTYVVDTTGDVVLEAEDVPGTDIIDSSVTLTLPTGVEGLTLSGAANIDATGNSLSNLIVGNSGNNRLDGGVAPNFFFKPSNDTLRGGAGDDTYVIREQPYTTYVIQEAAGEGIDTVEFNSSSNNFTLPTNVENLVITGSAMSASGNQHNNVITGNGGNNIMSGAQGADTLYGLAGNDTLEGGLEYGDFSDVLDGGLGDDTYRYRVGSGQDVVVEATPDARTDKQNILFIYGLGLASEVIPTHLVRAGDDLEVKVGAGTDKVTVRSFFAGSGPDNPLNPVQQIKFANGTTWNMAEILSRVTTGGTPSNTAPVLSAPLADQSAVQGASVGYTLPVNTFTDANVGDVLTYSAAQANGSALPAWLSFNPATRTFSGTAPTDMVGITSIKVTATDAAGASAHDVFDWTVASENKTTTGTNGADVLVGYSGNDSLAGAAGNDSLSGNAGNDLLDGGAGADVIDGGIGNDVVLFGLGDGQDVMQEATADSAAGKLNVLRFKSGVLASQVSVNRVASDLEVLIAGGSDKVTVKSFFAGTGPMAATNPLQRIEFADGTVWDIAHIQTLINTPTNTTPVLAAPLADQTVQQGGLVNYTVPESSFADTDAGDVLTYSATLANGAALPSWLSFNANTRTFAGTAPSALGVTSIKVVVTDSAGGTASDVFDLTVTAADNTLPTKNLVGTPGSDTLFGDSGNDVLNGAAGNDTYYFGRGQGQDQIRDLEWGANSDVLKFLSGVQAEQLWFRAAGNDLEISIIGTADKVTVRDWYQGEVYWVEQFKTADGRTLNAQNVNALVGAMASMAPPPLGQTSLSATQQAVLAPVFAANWSGASVVPPTNTTPVLNTPLADQSSPQGALVSYMVPANTFTDGDAGDVLTYSATLSNGSALPAWLSFNPGTRTFSGTAPTDTVGITSVKVTATDPAGASAHDVFDWTVASENKTTTGTNGADVLVGYSGNDSLAGAAGNDSLSGNAGNDLLDGGAGADVIDGGIGNDVVLFGLGDGQDVMQEATADSAAGKLNVLRFKSGVLASQVSVNRVASDLEVLIAGGSDRVTVKSFFAGTGPMAATNPLQRIEFADGTVWDIAHIQTLVNTPTNTAPVVATPLADQSVQQGALVNFAVPSATFTDADAGDVLTYSATLANGVSLPSWLSFDASTRTFTGTAPSVLGSTSIKVVATDTTGATASDVFDLTVSAADTTLPIKNLVGTPGNDTLFGDAGNDVLDGGSGNDTYYFGRGQGQDQIRDLEWGANTDVLKFLSNVQAEQLWFRNTGNDLEISVIGTTDKVTVRDWYQGEVYWVEQFKTADGRTLNAQSVNSLVAAMAGMAPPPLGQTSLSASQQAILAPVFGASWSGASTPPPPPPPPTNTTPVLAAPLADQTVQQGGLVNYTVPESSFADTDAGDVLTYSATLANGAALPSWLSFNANTRTFAGTAPSTLGATSIKVVATDSTGASASDVFDLTVTAADNTLPTKNLVGTPGNDTLFGDSGNDVLNGAAGNDTYYFGRGQGQDQIRDLEWGANSDVLKFLSGVQAEQLWFRAAGNDLEISIIGTADKVTVRDWYQGEVYWVEQFKTADGRTLNAHSVNAMVNAMAGMTPPPLGQTTLSTSQLATLTPLFAAHWTMPAMTSATNSPSGFITESSPAMEPLIQLEASKLAKMAILDSESGVMGGDADIGDASSALTSGQFMAPQSTGLTVQNTAPNAAQATPIDTITGVGLRASDVSIAALVDQVQSNASLSRRKISLRGLSEQAPVQSNAEGGVDAITGVGLRASDVSIAALVDQVQPNASLLRRKNYLEGLSEQALGQSNAEGGMDTIIGVGLRASDMSIAALVDQVQSNTSVLRRKNYLQEVSEQALMQLNAEAGMDASVHALINAMAAFAPPAAGEVSLTNNEPVGFKQVIAVDWVV